MARWESDAAQRLQYAAMTLFMTRGYDDVTVAEITERAGLTKRSFFNHFTDKREVLFAGAQQFQAAVVDHLAATDEALVPLEAAVAALTRAGQGLASYGDSAKARRDLIASSIELQERNLVKMASLATALAEVLQTRGTPIRTATFAARTAVTVFTVAYDDWADNTTEDFSAVMQRTLTDFRLAVGSPEGQPHAG
jgi:AcrR family transcriptional regulator